MGPYFVKILADVHCEWEGLNPVYRLYVDEEMFAERTWYWTDSYLEEIIQIQADVGEYELKWELVPPCLAKITVNNIRVEHGPATIENNKLKIYHESQ